VSKRLKKFDNKLTHQVKTGVIIL